jgi:hypothetical protein
MMASMVPTQSGDARAGVPRVLVGAAFAACVVTTVPGMTLLLQSVEQSAPDLRAIAWELPVGLLAGLFGVARFGAGAGTRRTVGALGAMAAALGYVLLAGAGLSFDEAAHTTAPVVVVGLGLTVGAVALDAAVLAGAWALLSMLKRRVEADLAAGDPRAGSVRCARWLVVAAAVHVVVKGPTGGPVVFGVIAALVGGVVAWRAGGRALAGWTAAVVAVAVGAQAIVRAHFAHARAMSEIALCEYVSPGPSPRANDVLAARVRALPGVADAVTFELTRDPSRTYHLKLAVLAAGGGPLSPALRQQLDAAIAAAPCAVDDDGARPVVAVQEAHLVPLAITARVKPSPGASADEVRRAVDRVVRDTVESRLERIHTRDRPSYEPPRPPGTTFADFKADGTYFETRIDQLAEGDVPTVASVEVELVP